MNWYELILSSPVEQVFRNNPTIVSLYEWIERNEAQPRIMFETVTRILTAHLYILNT